MRPAGRVKCGERALSSADSAAIRAREPGRLSWAAFHQQVPRDRLLIMDIPGGDGWEKLCPFINKPVPHNLTFPSRH